MRPTRPWVLRRGCPWGLPREKTHPGDAHGGDTDLGDARQGTTIPGIPPRGDAHGETPNPGVLTAGHPPRGCAPGARGWGSPRAGLAPAGAEGQVFGGGNQREKEREGRRQKRGGYAPAKGERPCGPAGKI